MPNDSPDLQKMEPAPLEDLPSVKTRTHYRIEIPREQEQRVNEITTREDAFAFIDDELAGELADWAAKNVNIIINIPHIPESAEGHFFRLILHRTLTLINLK